MYRCNIRPLATILMNIKVYGLVSSATRQNHELYLEVQPSARLELQLNTAHMTKR